MNRNIKLVIAYDGTDFHGWQTQPGVRTVQEELAGVLRRVVGHPLELIGASRTDAGVHARGQVANLHTSSPMPVDNLRRAIQDRLPEDVAIVQAREVPPDFHATRAARGKLYRYRLYHASARPVEHLLNRYCWHVWYRLDLDVMRAAAAALIGQHDFAGFANQGSPRASTVRTIQRIEIERRAREVFIDVAGDGFLYNQVRIVVGTLIEIGRGHWPVTRTREIIESRERGLAGTTAPAQGLCLQWVRYPPEAVPVTAGA